jgi:hypothetical protein
MAAAPAETEALPHDAINCGPHSSTTLPQKQTWKYKRRAEAQHGPSLRSSSPTHPPTHPSLNASANFNVLFNRESDRGWVNGLMLPYLRTLPKLVLCSYSSLDGQEGPWRNERDHIAEAERCDQRGVPASGGSLLGPT